MAFALSQSRMLDIDIGISTYMNASQVMSTVEIFLPFVDQKENGHEGLQHVLVRKIRMSYYKLNVQPIS